VSEPGGARLPDRRTALTVSCHVSERWLRFAEREQYEVLDEDLIQLDVMTLDDDGAPYKLCELVVSRGDLLRAVAAYGDPPLRTTPVRRADAKEPRRPQPKKRTATAEQPELVAGDEESGSS
jgi:hypothetical protein